MELPRGFCICIPLYYLTSFHRARSGLYTLWWRDAQPHSYNQRGEKPWREYGCLQWMQRHLYFSCHASVQIEDNLDLEFLNSLCKLQKKKAYFCVY